MSDEIKNTSSASMAVENAENVIKAEFNNLKRKLEETEAELESERKKSKQKLEEAKVKLQKEKEKSKQLDTLKASVAKGVKLRPKRARISLTLTKCADLFTKKEFDVFSDPMDIGGFQWKLRAKKYPTNSTWLGLFLCLSPPEHFNGDYEFDVNRSFRLLNVFPDKDIIKQGPTKRFNRKAPPSNGGWGFDTFVEIKKLLDPDEHFLQDDSIQLEVHFTVVEIATLDHLLPVEEKENGSKKSGK